MKMQEGEEHGAAEAHIVLGFNQHCLMTTSREIFPDSNKITLASGLLHGRLCYVANCQIPE